MTPTESVCRAAVPHLWKKGQILSEIPKQDSYKREVSLISSRKSVKMATVCNYSPELQSVVELLSMNVTAFGLWTQFPETAVECCLRNKARIVKAKRSYLLGPF